MPRLVSSPERAVPWVSWRTQKPPNGSVITEPQRKRFFAIWKGIGIPEDIVKAELKELGYNHSAEILKVDYEDLCIWAERFGRDDAPRADYDDQH